MFNYDLKAMSERKERRLNQEQLNAYGMPIKMFMYNRKMMLQFDDYDYSDNASMVKFNILPTENEAPLDQYARNFEALRTTYPKMVIEQYVDKICITVPKSDEDRQILSLKRILGSEDYNEFIKSQLSKDSEEQKDGLYFVLGETVDNQVIIKDLRKCVHLLIAGMTGSGKSVCVHTIINSLMYLYKPSELKFVMFDAKAVEMSFYEESRYLLEPICTDSAKAFTILDSLVNEMNKRYNLIRAYETRTIEGYNRLSKVDKMPYIVVIIDEYADLILTHKEVDEKIQQLAQKSRACGIHLIISTQQPKAEVVTSIIKANLPTRLSFRVADGNASRIILDEMGAELLSDNGDMLIKTAKETNRLQCAYLSEEDIINISEDIISKFGKNDFGRKPLTVAEEPNQMPSVAYVRKINEGENQDGKIVISDNAYICAAYAIEKNRASRVMFKNLLHVGDSKSSIVIQKMIQYGIIGEYDERTQEYPVRINADELKAKFVSVSEANV